MHITDLDTPVMLLDLEKLDRAIARMHRECASRGMTNRPHIKTHKIPALAKLQVEGGAVGITCQKLGEVEVFADAGAAVMILSVLMTMG